MSIKTSAEAVRPKEIKMQIHTGMLESLGINMYTSIGKSLVEFIANGFDAEANEVRVTIPFAEIEAARESLRADLKNTTENVGNEFQKISETLPDDLEIVIHDDGHGMTVKEVEDKFLMVNRNRRKQHGAKSESGLRTVMGRKGLGKLAGFGVAEQVIVRTKRVGESYATTFTMDFNDIKKHESIRDVKFTPTYEEGLAPEDQGTTITLKRLRYDSLKYKENSIETTLSSNFFITGNDFKIYLNEKLIVDPDVVYEFTFPTEDQRIHDGFAETNVKVHDGFEYPIRYHVKFRARLQKDQKPDGKIRGSLAAHLRGARVYCNQRLAAGPSLFNLESGMHNFHSQSYMECIVHADVLDQQETDLIGTNRSALKTDNEVVDAFVNAVTELMRVALYQHSKFRDQAVQEEMQQDPITQTVMAAVSQVPQKNREPAMKILTTLAKSEGVDSQAYKEIAPHFIKAINSSEILMELVKSGINPTDLQTIIGQLTELSSVEKSDTLKLYRARRNGIAGLQKLEEASHKGGRTDQYENELQTLLKTSPWLIKPEYSQYLTSDSQLGDVAKKINAELGIDDKANKKSKTYANKRPDLVFVLAEDGVMNISVVELKSPNIPLQNEHLSQLKGYMMEIEAMVSKDYQRPVKVSGHLIGNLPDADTKAMDSKLLLKEMAESGANSKWEVITLPQLLERARKIHQAVIAALEAEEKQEREN